MFQFYNNDKLLLEMIEKASANHNNPYFAQSKIIDVTKEVPSSFVKPVIEQPKQIQKEPIGEQTTEAPKPKPKRKPTAKKITLLKKTKQSLTEQEIIEMYNKLNLAEKNTKNIESEESEESPKVIKRCRQKNVKNKKYENNDD